MGVPLKSKTKIPDIEVLSSGIAYEPNPLELMKVGQGLTFDAKFTIFHKIIESKARIPDNDGLKALEFVIKMRLR